MEVGRLETDDIEKLHSLVGDSQFVANIYASLLDNLEEYAPTNPNKSSVMYYSIIFTRSDGYRMLMQIFGHGTYIKSSDKWKVFGFKMSIPDAFSYRKPNMELFVKNIPYDDMDGYYDDFSGLFNDAISIFYNGLLSQESADLLKLPIDNYLKIGDNVVFDIDAPKIMIDDLLDSNQIVKQGSGYVLSDKIIISIEKYYR